MKAIGSIIISMGKAMKNMIMGLSMKGTTRRENHQAMEDILGKMDNFMKENGKMG